MTIFIVVVDQTLGEAEYVDFRKAIAAYARCQFSDSAWLLDTSLDIEIVQRELLSQLHYNDKLLISKLANEWFCSRGDRLESWLSSPKRRWAISTKKSLFLRLFED